MTKLANIMFTYELAERLEGRGHGHLHAPGGVNTRFGTNKRGPMTICSASSSRS
jgi:NAD(P)-dependent dehydrogenase (short-subunit alcohol dehydrogenase family)